MAHYTLEYLNDAGITTCRGFKANGIAAGLKKSGKLDLALVYSSAPCTSAAVFTRNAFKAAPVWYDMQVLSSGALVHGVAVNSGCANACTGDQGMIDAREMAQIAEQAMEATPGTFYVMSTGVIGQHMPMDTINKGIHQAATTLCGERAGGANAAKAIMTTDTHSKEVAVRVNTDEGSFTVAGMAKGSGMIHPNMATMLCIITTDAAIAAEQLQTMLNKVIDSSFNMITVDGDTSTNDTVLVLANGAADLSAIESEAHPLYPALLTALDEVVTHLAREIVRDGEGAEHLVEIVVEGAVTKEDARAVARSIANSSLVKTAIYGRDANWGRVICAVGYSGATIEPEKVSLKLGDMALFSKGTPIDFDEEHASQLLAQKEVRFAVDLGLGNQSATMWTCDLTHEYVNINANYRT